MRLSQEYDLLVSRLRSLQRRGETVTVGIVIRDIPRLRARMEQVSRSSPNSLLRRIASREFSSRCKIYDCEDCGDHVIGFDLDAWNFDRCPGCNVERNHCTNCGDSIDDGDEACSEPEYYCSRCFSRLGMWLCGDCGCGNDSEYSECDSCGEEKPGLTGEVQQYHGTKGRQRLLPDKWSTSNRGLLLGVELEVQPVTIPAGKEFVKRMRDHFGDLLRGFEQDRSLNEHGCEPGIEMITQAASLPALASRFMTMPHVEKIRSHDTGTCGLHVHASREAFGGQTHYLRLTDAVNSPLMQEFLDAVSRRPASFYCRRGVDLMREIDMYANVLIRGVGLRNTRILPWSISTLEPGRTSRDLILGGRYQHLVSSNALTGDMDHCAVDFSHDNTVEFRMFRGTTRPETIVATLEFVVAMISWTRPGNNEHGSVLRPIWDPHDFVEYINRPHMSAETKHLRRYIAEQWPDGRPRVARKIKDGVVVVDKKARRKEREVSQCA